MIFEKPQNLIRRFLRAQDGVTTTEYLIALGLVTGAVIVAVLAFGDELSATWMSWAGWVSEESGNLTPPPG